MANLLICLLSDSIFYSILANFVNEKRTDVLQVISAGWFKIEVRRRKHMSTKNEEHFTR